MASNVSGQISNPMAYYEVMGFTSIDSLVYSASLIGALGGIAGSVKGFFSGEVKQGLIFAALAGVSLLSAMEGLKIANAFDVANVKVPSRPEEY